MEIFFSKTVWRGKCLEWQAARNAAGYGVFRRDGRNVLAHRMAFMLHHGKELPKGAVVMHSCDNPSCVNHAHLALGSHRENHDDKKKKGRSNTGMSHGHHKLTDAQVHEIRALQMRQRDIASVFGVSQSVISEIRAKKAWRHL
jgi:DNA-binding transcriptional regulator YiaG